MSQNPADEMLAGLGAEPLSGSGFENDHPVFGFEHANQIQAEVVE